MTDVLCDCNCRHASPDGFCMLEIMADVPNLKNQINEVGRIMKTADVCKILNDVFYCEKDENIVEVGG